MCSLYFLWQVWRARIVLSCFVAILVVSNIAASLHSVWSCLSVPGSQWQHCKRSSWASSFTANSSNSYSGNPSVLCLELLQREASRGNASRCPRHFSFWVLFLWRSSMPRPSRFDWVLTLSCRLRRATLWRDIMFPICTNCYIYAGLQPKDLDRRWGSEFRERLTS